MTKTLFSLIPPPLRSICIIALILSLCACSLVNDLSSERASLSFTITGELADRINSASRARSADSADGLYLDIALEGDYEDEKTISVSEGSTVKFENIPTGLSVYATAQAYEMDGGEKFVFYEGESEKITIQEGENALSLFLQKVESDIIRLYISANGNANDGNGSKAKPFKTLAQACHEITDATKTYWLIIEGELAGNQLLVDDDQIGEVYQAKAIVIKGNSENGADGINANNKTRALTIGTAVPVTLKNMTITGGNMTANGGDGGGLYVSNGANVTIAEGTIITGNQAERGGGVFVETGGQLTMTGGTISNNTASSMGGGVYPYSSDGFVMKGGTIDRNSAQNGGGIYLNTAGNSGNGFSMTGGTISNNTASSKGGGIYVFEYPKITLSNAKITGNSAIRSGGGIFIGDGNGYTHTITGCTISENKVTSGNGGGLYLESATTILTGGTKVLSNTASGSGGGAYVKATLNIENATFSGNSASTGNAFSTYNIDSVVTGYSNIPEEDYDLAN